MKAKEALLRWEIATYRVHAAWVAWNRTPTVAESNLEDSHSTQMQTVEALTERLCMPSAYRRGSSVVGLDATLTQLAVAAVVASAGTEVAENTENTAVEVFAATD